MLRQILNSPALINSQAWSLRVRSATSFRTNATKKGQNPQDITQQELTDPCKGEGGDQVFVETKHIHDEIKDVEDGHVHVEIKDVEIKVAKNCKMGVAQQPDYSGKLWEDGHSSEGENVIQVNMDDPNSHQLPSDWDMQDPNVKGEGGDRVYYEAKHLQNADMKNEDKTHKPETNKNLK